MEKLLATETRGFRSGSLHLPRTATGPCPQQSPNNSKRALGNPRAKKNKGSLRDTLTHSDETVPRRPEELDQEPRRRSADTALQQPEEAQRTPSQTPASPSGSSSCSQPPRDARAPSSAPGRVRATTSACSAVCGIPVDRGRRSTSSAPRIRLPPPRRPVPPSLNPPARRVSDSLPPPPGTVQHVQVPQLSPTASDL